MLRLAGRRSGFNLRSIGDPAGSGRVRRSPIRVPGEWNVRRGVGYEPAAVNGQTQTVLDRSDGRSVDAVQADVCVCVCVCVRARACVRVRVTVTGAETLNNNSAFVQCVWLLAGRSTPPVVRSGWHVLCMYVCLCVFGSV